MLNWMLSKMADPLMDDAMEKMLTAKYADNPFVAVTASEKLSTRAIVEAGMRAETGKALERPLGSPVNLDPWEKVLLNPKQLFQLPAEDPNQINTQTVIGPQADRPLNLDIPIMITGMSYGASVSLPFKVALAKGATQAGTATNTGESAVTDEERKAAKYLIGQYNRGGWLNTPEQLKLVDAIEVQFGQAAWGGGVTETTKSDKVGPELRKLWNIEKGQDAVIHARMPGTASVEDIINLINGLKSEYDVPVGVKIAGSDYIEYELEVISKTDADFIVIDGFGGGTAGATVTLEDNLGLPLLYCLPRAIQWLEDNNMRNRFTVIASGRLKTPGHFLKALALGADAVYIGSIAITAALHTQVIKPLPQTTPPQLILYDGTLKDELDVDRAAQCLANFLQSCIAEMRLAAQALGKNAVNEINSDDLVSVDRELSESLRIRYAGTPRR
ncbi:MAG: FMN-binding glutamate synthase family protein [Syntrophaceticus sp.]|jgi:glutamate synthase domain-containing protein 2|nr:FMN-binding glutamate synthase family protein [Syntrophaceticus sp.]MDD4360609.1 FMN-binding glutamate synthase family protein [Syntrophaceticus sp.]